MSNQTIRPEQFESCLKEIFDDYSKETQRAVDDSLPIVGNETVRELKKTSPKDRGNYSKGWKKKLETDRFGKKLIVYNKEHYRLTHLLEKGHAKVNGGRTKAIPHIKPAQDKAVKNTVKEIKRRLG